MFRESLFSLPTLLILLCIVGVISFAAPRAADAQTTTVTGVTLKFQKKLGEDSYSAVQASTSDTTLKAGDLIIGEVTFSANVDVYASAHLKLKIDDPEWHRPLRGQPYYGQIDIAPKNLTEVDLDNAPSPSGAKVQADVRTVIFEYKVLFRDEDLTGIEIRGDGDAYGGFLPTGHWQCIVNANTQTNMVNYQHGGAADHVKWVDADVDYVAMATAANANAPRIENSAPFLPDIDPDPILEQYIKFLGAPKSGRHYSQFVASHRLNWGLVQNPGDRHYYLDPSESDDPPYDANGYTRAPVTGEPNYAAYNVGEKVRFELVFNEEVRVVRTDPDIPVTMKVEFDTPVQSKDATLVEGGDGTSEKLIFECTVEEGDGDWGAGLQVLFGAAPQIHGGTVQDLAGNEAIVPSWFYGRSEDFASYFRAVDTYPPTVRIARVPVDDNGDVIEATSPNDTDSILYGLAGWRGESVRLPSSAGTETGTFTTYVTFFNMFPAGPSNSGRGPSKLAEDLHPDAPFEASDIQITAPEEVLQDTNVTLRYRGMWGRAVTAAQARVYLATITPPLGFDGEMAIQVPAGATMDLAGNENYVSNTLTVPIDTRLKLTEAPEIVAPPAGAYAAGDEIEVEMTYTQGNLRYEGDNPPYLTLYLGEEVPANARHATWKRAEDANSTKVTFAYTVAATDVATAVSIAPIGMTVPERTTLLDDSGQQLQGRSDPANKSGEGLAATPPPGQGQLQLGESDEGLAPRTDVPINLIYLPEEVVSKAAATDVPRSPVVFNELGNGSGDANDWLELRNVTGSAVSLKDWELSVVQDGKKEDTSLIVFPDASVPANGLLLITNSAPDKTLLAAGDDIADSGKNGGAKHLYLVNPGLSLPDDGKFLLILRNAKEKLGMNEAFVDVAGGGGSGTDAFIREQTGDYDTHVWPLQVLQAPGGDTEEALGSGKVWQRANAGVVGYHKDAWAAAAFTGIGYDRKVTQSAATSGTPGYPNVAAKETATKGSVTLSEIMLDSAGGTLPQWIELYNNSKTEVLNLNRWRLEIQNVDSEDLVGRPIVTLTLGEKVIQPNQTLLIVAGPARASSGSYLPADRVYDLLALHEKNLRIKSARDTFLSTEGFYLKLTDRNGALVDEVGNTDGDRRSDDAPAWAVPLSVEEGSRSSVIRRYDNGVARPGQKRASWVLAARIKKVASSSDALYWGDADDIGTPGHRRGGALPVELSSFSVTRNEAGAVVLTWTTESEVDNAGFNLRRSEKRASGFKLINAALIAGAGTTGERQTYTFTDTSAKPGVEYYYQIEEVAFDGKPETLAMRMLRGPVSASNRMLTTFGALKKRE